jgi:3-hydroxyisobutyrate dehydrogenase-like beta-hydroxyacid dehydrogenase
VTRQIPQDISMDAHSCRIGFIGLGLMGSPIAMKLIEAGHQVWVWGRTPEKLAPAIAAGAKVAETPRALAAAVDVVMLCVTDAPAVEQVVFGADGIAAGGSWGSILIDHSSIRPASTREMAARLRVAAAMDWIDAPVSGGVPGVLNKTLVVMCGGEQQAFDRARPIIETYAGCCTRVGGIGAGQTTKLFNQAICGITFVAIAEVTALAIRAGVDAAGIPAAIAGGRADSRILQEFMPRMARHDRERTGRIDTMLKDLQAVAEMAHESGATIPCVELAADVHRQLIERGLGPEDPATIVSFFE